MANQKKLLVLLCLLFLSSLSFATYTQNDKPNDEDVTQATLLETTENIKNEAEDPPAKHPLVDPLLEKMPYWLSEISSKIVIKSITVQTLSILSDLSETDLKKIVESEGNSIAYRETGKLVKGEYSGDIQPYWGTLSYVILSDKSAKKFISSILSPAFNSKPTYEAIANVITPSIAKIAGVLIDNLIVPSEKNPFSEAIKIAPYYITTVFLKNYCPNKAYNHAMNTILLLVFSMPNSTTTYMGIAILGTFDIGSLFIHIASEGMTALSSNLVKNWIIKPTEAYTAPLSKWIQTQPVIIAIFIPLNPNSYSTLYKKICDVFPE